MALNLCSLASGEMENPFIMSDLDAPEQAEKNIAFYQTLGRQENPNVFNILREQEYDGIIERSGDRCFLYPEKVEILISLSQKEEMLTDKEEVTFVGSGIMLTSFPTT